MNNEIKAIKMGLLTALVLVATVGVLTIVVMSPNGGITSSAHALKMADPASIGGCQSNSHGGPAFECQ
jgi:hypothetical protein